MMWLNHSSTCDCRQRCCVQQTCPEKRCLTSRSMLDQMHPLLPAGKQSVEQLELLIAFGVSLPITLLAHIITRALLDLECLSASTQCKRQLKMGLNDSNENV
eukprot:4261079-Amphidinium_carterae.1